MTFWLHYIYMPGILSYQHEKGKFLPMLKTWSKSFVNTNQEKAKKLYIEDKKLQLYYNIIVIAKKLNIEDKKL